MDIAEFDVSRKRLGLYDEFLYRSIKLFQDGKGSPDDHEAFKETIGNLRGRFRDDKELIGVLDEYEQIYNCLKQVRSLPAEPKAHGTIGVLEPDGTFSFDAARLYASERGFKPELVPYASIERCFRAVESGEAHQAIVPILNSSSDSAWVNETLRELRYSQVYVCGEVILPIVHHLIAIPGATAGSIKYVHSKDKAIEQCRGRLSQLLPQAQIVYEGSTAAAARKIKELGALDRATIASERAAELCGLEILINNVHDDSNNKTRFIVLGREDHQPTGNDKTILLFEFRNVEQPALLHGLLGELAERGISLAYIQSIPKDGKLDEFTFYLDIRGHRSDENVSQSLRAIEANPELSFWKLLGSYPNSAK